MNLNLGKEKVFEVVKYYNDYQLINEFFTEDFCNKNEFFEWARNPDGTYEIASKVSGVKSYQLAKNIKGKGAALKHGINYSSGDLI